ncbi:MAG: hypothetical protein U0835_20720 [Isosphaeraceae bacterium]
MLHETYLGPEDETATGPNFPRQNWDHRHDRAPGQTITNLDVTDLLPNTLQYERDRDFDPRRGDDDDRREQACRPRPRTVTRRFAASVTMHQARRTTFP